MERLDSNSRLDSTGMAFMRRLNHGSQDDYLCDFFRMSDSVYAKSMKMLQSIGFPLYQGLPNDLWVLHFAVHSIAPKDDDSTPKKVRRMFLVDASRTGRLCFAMRCNGRDICDSAYLPKSS